MPASVLLTVAALALVGFVVFALRLSRRAASEASARREAEGAAQAIEARLRGELQMEVEARQKAEAASAQTEARFRGVVEADAEQARVKAETARLLEEAQTEGSRMRQALSDERGRAQSEAERVQAARDREAAQASERQLALDAQVRETNEQLESLRSDVSELSEVAHLQDFGFYEPRFDFATSELYKRRLDDLRNQQKAMAKDGRAVVSTIQWEVAGSRAKGEQMTKEFAKLILRGFNGEADAAVARVRYNNVAVMEARVRKAFEAVNRLGKTQGAFITDDYLDTKIGEIRLAYEYYEKRQREAEEQRQIREQMRDEEVARREIEKAEREAARDEDRYEKALVQARLEAEAATGARHDKLAAQIALLEQRLAEAHTQKARAISRAQMTRSGHVYVISNVGSFGEHVYKIGMTRRLDPIDRVMELGDASVPFRFDVHAIIYSDDAPGLEAKLHRAFHHRRVNLVNERKEFFRVDLGEIEREVTENHGEFEFTLAAEAEEYNKTLALARDRDPGGDGERAGVSGLPAVGAPAVIDRADSPV